MGRVVASAPKGTPPAPTVKNKSKGECSTDYAPRPKRDPNPMCEIDGGSFMMGATEEESQIDEHPRHLVKLSSFYIDQFEVTNAQYAFFLNAVGGNEVCDLSINRECAGVKPYPAWAELEKIPNGSYRSVPGTERWPVSRVSRQGAELYCLWAGKQLPTEAQWEYAARHDPKTGRDLRFPWGDRFEPKRANCGEPLCKDGFEKQAPVGTFDGTGGFKDGSSPWGVHDMTGNALEWVADCYAAYEPCDGGCTDPTGPPGAPDCEAVERSQYADGPPPNVLRTFSRNRSTWRGAFNGFRCARPAETN